jgi:uncharacterized protein YyaL (SSP411 family)
MPERQADLARLMPWVGAMRMHGDRATAYVCRNFACDLPVTAPDALREQLSV